MANVSGSMSAQATFNFTKTALLPSGGVTSSLSFPAFTQTFANGTGSGQIDEIYLSNITVAGTPGDLDLTALVDPFTGGTYNFARAKAVLIRNNDATNGLTIGLGTNPWTAFLGGTTPTVALGPSGMVAFVSPLATGFVVSGSSKVLRVNPGANTVNFDILIVGCSA